MPRRKRSNEVPLDLKAFPRPKAIRKAAVIVGGLWDTRPQSEWHPTDAQSETAFSRSGKRLRVRAQCCHYRTSKQGGGRCCRAVRTDHKGRAIRTGCANHAGTKLDTPATAAVDKIRHGRYAPFLGTELDRFEEFLAQRDIANPEPDLSLLDVRIEQEFARANMGDTRAFRRIALDAFASLRTVLDAEPEEVRLGPSRLKALANLESVMTLGVESDRALAVADDLLIKRAKLANSVRRTEIAGEEVLSKARVIAGITAILEIVRRHVTRETAEQIQDAVAYEVLEGGADAPRAGA